MATKTIKTCEEYVLNEIAETKQELQETQEALNSKTRALNAAIAELKDIKEAIQLLGKPGKPIEELDPDDGWSMEISAYISTWDRERFKDGNTEMVKKVKAFKTLYRYLPIKEEEKEE